MQHEIFKLFIFPFPTSQPIIKFPTFSPISRLGGDPVRIINSESYFIKDSLKRNWWKVLRGNENVNKLLSFVDFGVPLNYNFKLCTFLISTAQIVAKGGKWVESRKDGRVLQNQRNSSDQRKSGIMLVLGDGKERQVYFTRRVSISKGLSQGRLFSR